MELKSGSKLELHVQRVAQINPETGISDDYLNKYASIHGQLQTCAMMIAGDKLERAAEIGGKIRNRLAHVPSYSSYARRELIPKVGTLVKGRPNPLTERDLINARTRGKVWELDVISERLHRTVEDERELDLDALLDLLQDGYATLHGDAFAEEKMASLKREVAPAHDTLEQMLSAA